MQYQPPPHYEYVNSERDLLSLPLRKHKTTNALPPPHRNDSPEDEISIRKYIGSGIGLVSLITENLLSHPFVVLRRQCQVHRGSNKYHLTPFTLFPVIAHLQRRQGVPALWKGIGSVLLVRGSTLAVEDVIYKFFGWPKEIHSRTSMRHVGQHVMLKCLSLVTILPFYSASLVETVQSEIASEKPGVFDVFREGMARLTEPGTRGRLLPVWLLAGPFITFGLTRYMFGLVIKGISTRIMTKKYHYQGAKPRELGVEEIEIYATLTSLIITEITFYPLETVMHRLQLQGTRTIIDNLDTGFTVIPILTNYEGFFDCYKNTLNTEGITGLYKGFGALILQFFAHVIVIKVGRWVICRITDIVSNKPPPKVAEYYNLDVRNSHGSTTVSQSISGVSSISDENLN